MDAGGLASSRSNCSGRLDRDVAPLREASSRRTSSTPSLKSRRTVQAPAPPSDKARGCSTCLPGGVRPGRRPAAAQAPHGGGLDAGRPRVGRLGDARRRPGRQGRARATDATAAGSGPACYGGGHRHVPPGPARSRADQAADFTGRGRGPGQARLRDAPSRNSTRNRPRRTAAWPPAADPGRGAVRPRPARRSSPPAWPRRPRPTRTSRFNCSPACCIFEGRALDAYSGAPAATASRQAGRTRSGGCLAADAAAVGREPGGTLAIADVQTRCGRP